MKRPELNKRSLSTMGQQCACLNARKAARAVTQYYDEVGRPAGIRATQFSQLALAAGRGPITVTAMAEFLVMDRTTLTRNLAVLERRRLLRVIPGEDRRERLVSITAKGRRVLAEAIPLWEEAQATIANSLGARRLKRFLSDAGAVVAAAQGA